MKRRKVGTDGKDAGGMNSAQSDCDKAEGGEGDEGAASENLLQQIQQIQNIQAILQKQREEDQKQRKEDQKQREEDQKQREKDQKQHGKDQKQREEDQKKRKNDQESREKEKALVENLRLSHEDLKCSHENLKCSHNHLAITVRKSSFHRSRLISTQILLTFLGEQPHAIGSCNFFSDLYEHTLVEALVRSAFPDLRDRWGKTELLNRLDKLITGRNQQVHPFCDSNLRDEIEDLLRFFTRDSFWQRLSEAEALSVKVLQANAKIFGCQSFPRRSKHLDRVASCRR
jgi:hypothetical protein